MNIQIKVGKFIVSKEEGLEPHLTSYNMTGPNFSQCPTNPKPEALIPKAIKPENLVTDLN